MTTEFGVKALGQLVILNNKRLTESAPGAIYELWIHVDKPFDEQTVVRTLLRELKDRKELPGLKVRWLSANSEKKLIRMQIEGSPFPWAALLFFLPAILSLVGLSVILISVFLLISSVPSSTLALLTLGALLLFIGPRIRSFLTGGERR